MALAIESHLEKLDGHYDSKAGPRHADEYEQSVIMRAARRDAEKAVKVAAAEGAFQSQSGAHEAYKSSVLAFTSETFGNLLGLRLGVRQQLEAGEAVDPIAVATGYYNLCNRGAEMPGAVDNLRVQLRNVAVYGAEAKQWEQQHAGLAQTLALLGILTASVAGLELIMTSDLPDDHISAPGTASIMHDHFTVAPVLAAEPALVAA